ncbi:hypothetical protein DFS34DRAFT_593252 [Phlyctochytrium arcticum]|nr:hypothetical protein DFS34DRAFT_593252 [Phlyctochytrium arcticum]
MSNEGQGKIREQTYLMVELTKKCDVGKEDDEEKETCIRRLGQTMYSRRGKKLTVIRLMLKTDVDSQEKPRGQEIKCEVPQLTGVNLGLPRNVFPLMLQACNQKTLLENRDKMEVKKAELREKFTRTWYKEPGWPHQPERLCDVIIQVYPNGKVAAAGDATDTSSMDETPEACIPAHSAILANSNKYFYALFTNGMAQTHLYSAGLVGHGRLGTSASDEYEDISLFDNVSIALMADYLYPVEAGYHFVIHLLKIAYKFSRETSEVLRKGCISFCTDNYHDLLQRPSFTTFFKEFACRDLALAIALKFQELIACGAILK